MTELSSEIRNALYVACGFARNRNVETVVETFLAAARAEGARECVEATLGEIPQQMFDLYIAVEPCWTGTGCTHDSEGECADAFWALAKRLRREARAPSTDRLAAARLEGARDMRTILTRCETRIRHDHAYPVDVGPHRCDGCDLEADLRALLADGGEPQ